MGARVRLHLVQRTPTTNAFRYGFPAFPFDRSIAPGPPKVEFGSRRHLASMTAYEDQDRLLLAADTGGDLYRYLQSRRRLYFGSVR